MRTTKYFKNLVQENNLNNLMYEYIPSQFVSVTIYFVILLLNLNCGICGILTALCSSLEVAELKKSIIKCRAAAVPYRPQKPIWFFEELCEGDVLLKDGVPSALPHHTNCGSVQHRMMKHSQFIWLWPLPYQS